MSAPRCTSWLGHRFVARFDTENGADFEGLGQVISPELVRACKERRTYVHDICTRCGHVIERSSPTTERRAS